MVADRGGLDRMIDVEKPVGDVDPVHHQIGEKAAAEIPEPAPVAEAILIERLVGRRPRKSFQATWRGSTPCGPRCGAGRAASVPAQVDLEDLADPPALDQSRAFWMWGMLRCCMPTWTIFVFRFWASMIAAPSARSWVSGFST